MANIINEQLSRMRGIMGINEFFSMPGEREGLPAPQDEAFEPDYSENEYFIDEIQSVLYSYMDYSLKHDPEVNPEQFRSDIEVEINKLLDRYMQQNFQKNQEDPYTDKRKELAADSFYSHNVNENQTDDGIQYMNVGGEKHGTPTKNIDFFVDSIRRKKPNGVTPTEAISRASEWEFIQDDADKYIILSKLANAGLLNLGDDGIRKLKPSEVGAFIDSRKDIANQIDRNKTMGVNETYILEKKDIINKFKKQYGKKKGEKIYYATANKQDRNPETFQTNEETLPNGVTKGDYTCPNCGTKCTVNYCDSCDRAIDK